MRLCNKTLLGALLAAAAFTLSAQTPPAQPSSTTNLAQLAGQPPSLAVDTDPVRSPDTGPSPAESPLKKQGGNYVLRTDVDEVVLNATVLNGHQLVQGLTKNEFEVYEDGVKQTILSFQHTDLPVSMGLVIDNSGSMYRKRPAVNKSALDLIEASNPQDQAFVVNFSDEAFIDADFTNSIEKLRQGLSHIDSRGGTALYDAVVASADKLAADGKRPKAGSHPHHRRRGQRFDPQPGADYSPRSGALRARSSTPSDCYSATKWIAARYAAPGGPLNCSLPRPAAWPSSPSP